MTYKKHKKLKSTQAFRADMIIRTILKTLNWRGSHMLWPYTWNGHRLFARIKAEKILKAIEWDLFYDDPEMPSEEIEMLKKIVDDGTTVVSIPTPRGWKCERKGCKIDYMHEHTTYTALQKP